MTRTCLFVTLVLVTCSPGGSQVSAEVPVIALESQPGSVAVTVGGRPLATYFYADETTTRPYFAHVHAPAGVQVTRNHPPQANDLQDHATLHPGIWLAFGDISGHDYWRLRARVVHERFVEPPRGGAGQGGFAVRNRYLATDGQSTVCSELCRFTFYVREEGYLIVWQSTFASQGGDFSFGDQEEMGLGVRLASDLREDGGSGRILSSEGLRGARQTWGQAATWCDYAGDLDGQPVGITIMAAPQNARPSWWHNRGYGFFAANLFGRAAMRQGPQSKLVVKPGESLNLGYGILIHSSEPDAVDLQRAYDDYRKLVSGVHSKARLTNQPE